MEKSLFVIELVGPPGSGKTTLSEALHHQDGIRREEFPNIREMNNLVFFIRNGFVVLPAFCALYPQKYEKRAVRQELVYMIILTGWPRLLEHQAVSDRNALVLDQGPIYMLTGLFQYNPKILNNCVTRAWWRKICGRWRDALDLVICLDAPDETLIGRIRRREKRHGIKTNTDQKAIQYLADHRVAQERVISDLMPDGTNCRVFSFDTAQMPFDETLTNILDLLRKTKKQNVVIK